MKLPNHEEYAGTVIDEVFISTGEMHGIASNGGAVRNGTHGFCLKFVKSESSPYIRIQLIATGFGKRIENQTYVRPKTIVKEKIVEIEKKKQEPQILVGNKEDI